MTERSPGAGWWLASDGNWYPPDLHPDMVARSTETRPLALPAPSSDLVTIPTVLVEPPSPVTAGLAVPSDADLLRSTDRRERPARPKPRPASRRSGALVGAAAACLAVVGAVWLGRPGERAQLADDTSVTAAAIDSAPATTGSVAANTGVAVNTLSKGTCIDEPALGEGLATTVNVVACSASHTHEAYHVATYTESDSYDAGRIEAFADDLCVREFRRYLGIDYARSKYTYLAILPTEQTWVRDRDRSLLCLAYAEDARVTGSLVNIQQ